jgi:hypothetical protein
MACSLSVVMHSAAFLRRFFIILLFVPPAAVARYIV